MSNPTRLSPPEWNGDRWIATPSLTFSENPRRIGSSVEWFSDRVVPRISPFSPAPAFPTVKQVPRSAFSVIPDFINSKDTNEMLNQNLLEKVRGSFQAVASRSPPSSDNPGLLCHEHSFQTTTAYEYSETLHTLVERHPSIEVINNDCEQVEKAPFTSNGVCSPNPVEMQNWPADDSLAPLQLDDLNILLSPSTNNIDWSPLSILDYLAPTPEEIDAINLSQYPMEEISLSL